MLICNAERKHKQLLAVIGIGAGAILTACQRPAEATPIPATLTEPCPPAVLSEDEYVF